MAVPFRQRFRFPSPAHEPSRGTVAMIIRRHITAGPVAVDFFGVGVTLGPVLGLIGEQDPAFPVPLAEAGWITRVLRARAVMVPRPVRTPQSQRPNLTAAAVLRFLESVTGRA